MEDITFMDNLGVKKIWQKDERTLGILWTDDKESSLDVVELRRRCPCAACVDEWTRQQILKPEDVADSVRPIAVKSIGRYAVNIRFNDKHGTGIYTYQTLRQMDQ